MPTTCVPLAAQSRLEPVTVSNRHPHEAGEAHGSRGPAHAAGRGLPTHPQAAALGISKASTQHKTFAAWRFQQPTPQPARLEALY